MVVSAPDRDYEPAPAGWQKAVCARVYDLGLQEGGYAGKIQHKCVFLFELEARRKDGTRFTLTKEYTASLARKSTLRKDLIAWRGSDFSEAELKGFDLDKTAGKTCLLRLVEKPREGGRAFIEIEELARPPKGSEPLEVEVPADYVPAWVTERILYQVVQSEDPPEAPEPEDPVF